MLPGQTVAVVLSRPPREIELLPEDLNLEVVHQDADFVVVNKPAGMVVHPAYGHYSGTLVNGLMHLFQELPFTSDRDRPGLVHRIDKNTSGLLVVAVNDYAMTHLAKQFFDRSTDRRYTAIVWGSGCFRVVTTMPYLCHPPIKLMIQALPVTEHSVGP